MSLSSTNFDVHAATNLLQESHVVIVHTQWNKEHVSELVRGAESVLQNSGNAIKITLIEVPGSVEIPFAISAHYKKNSTTAQRADAYIAFGIVIKGDTSHFKYVCNSVTQGITILNTTLSVPVIYGILTVHNIIQVKERLGGAHGHKGEEAAITAMRMIAINRNL